MQRTPNAHAQRRGRPRLRDDDDILRAALHAFAEHGYEGMSLRGLNAAMGLSRGTINRRFASKERLWYAAVDHGFHQLIADLNAEVQGRGVPADDLSLVREIIRAFLNCSTRSARSGQVDEPGRPALHTPPGPHPHNVCAAHPGGAG